MEALIEELELVKFRVVSFAKAFLHFERTGNNMERMFSKRICCLSLSSLCLMIGSACLGGAMVGVRAQERALKFDVVSIKPSAPGATVYDGGGIGVTDDGFYSRILPLSAVLKMAYFPMSDRAGVVKNLPDWMKKENYDVVAKVAAEDVEAWQKMSKKKNPMVADNTMVQQALQTMLAERMKLAVHTEPTEVDGYALVVSKRGAKLAEARPGDPDPERAMQLTDGGKAVAVSGPNRSITQLTFYNSSMETLRGFLSNGVMKPLVDETGLKGKYQFVLYPRDFGPDEMKSPDQTDTWELEAVGLELRPTKVKSQNIVIDHIERPSPN